MTAGVITLIAAVALGIGKGFTYETITDFKAAEVPTVTETIARTATNVVGAATAAVLVAETEGLLDQSIYYDDIESTEQLSAE